MQERTRAGLAVARTRQKGGRRPLQPEDPRVWMAYTMYGDQRFTVLDIGHTFTQEAVITRLLRHVKLAAVPPLGLPVRAKKRSTGWHKTPEASGPPCGGQHAPLPTTSRVVSGAMCVQRRCLS
jgi:hypothetical protein